MNHLRRQCLLWGGLLCLTIMVCGCGGTGDTGSETGAIKFQIEEAGGMTAKQADEMPAASPILRFVRKFLSVDSAVAKGFLDDCNSDFFSIEAYVYGDDGSEIAGSGPWPCSYHSGSIQNVPRGENRRVVVHARTAEGALMYHGEKGGLNVLSGETTDAGVIRLMPFEKFGYIQMSDGAMIYYEMKGEGPPLILINGVDQTSDSWDFQFDEFAKSYTVIRYDIRYFGRSYKEGVDSILGQEDIYIGMTWGDTEQQITTDLVEIMQYMNLDKAHICGLSIGASIAAQLAVFHPEMVDKLIFTSPDSFPYNDNQLNVLKDIEEKTLIISGADDTWPGPDYVERMAIEYGYSPTTIVMQNAARYCNEEQPDVYNQYVLEWLAGELIISPDPPNLHGFSSFASFIENCPPVLIAEDAVIEHPAGKRIMELRIQILNFYQGDQLFADILGTNLSVSFDSTGLLRLQGVDTAETYQRVLRTVAFENTAEAPASDQRAILFQIVDMDGDAVEEVNYVNVLPVNDAPVNQAPGNVVTLIGSSTEINDISIMDVDVGSGQVLVTLRTDFGFVRIVGDGSGAEINNNGGLMVTMEGTVAQVNAALQGLTYSPFPDFSGEDRLTITVNDQGFTGVHPLNNVTQDCSGLIGIDLTDDGQIPPFPNEGTPQDPTALEVADVITIQVTEPGVNEGP